MTSTRTSTKKFQDIDITHDFIERTVDGTGNIIRMEIYYTKNGNNVGIFSWKETKFVNTDERVETIPSGSADSPGECYDRINYWISEKSKKGRASMNLQFNTYIPKNYPLDDLASYVYNFDTVVEQKIKAEEYAIHKEEVYVNRTDGPYLVSMERNELWSEYQIVDKNIDINAINATLKNMRKEYMQSIKENHKKHLAELKDTFSKLVNGVHETTPSLPVNVMDDIITRYSTDQST